MRIPTDLSLRQTLEGMPLAFDAEAAGGLEATVQFDVSPSTGRGTSGPESGVYHLRIADGECSFHVGPAAAPTLTISTPSDVWLAISRGKLDGQEALMRGRYTANGDINQPSAPTERAVQEQRETLN